MDNLPGSPENQQAMDKKKAAFKQSSERTKNTPKKEGFVFPVLKPDPVAFAVPLPPEPEEAEPENMFERRPNYGQKDLEKEFPREEDKVGQEEGTDSPTLTLLFHFVLQNEFLDLFGQSALVRSKEDFWDQGQAVICVTRKRDTCN